MITPPLNRAIGQIRALDDTLLGTGFLISVDAQIGKVLTARHVVEGHRHVKIYFDKAEKQTMISKAIVRGTHDWAMLSIQAPEDVAPLVLYRPSTTSEMVRWCTIGYPNLTEHKRAGLHGMVRVADLEELDLHCAELPNAGPSSLADGLSGAPCLIDGGVAGIISDAMQLSKKNPTNPTAGLFALPSKIIAEESGLTLTNGTELPYELFFTGIIQPWPEALRQIAAGIAKLDRSVVYPPNIIARRMINEGLEITGNVLRGLKRPSNETEPLIDLASTLWISGQAAAHLDEVLGHYKTALLVTDSELSTRHHLWRAFACRNDSYPTWDCVHIGAIHDDIDEIIADVETKLGELFGDIPSAAVARIIESGDGAGRLVTAFLHGAPREDLTQKLKSKWAKLRIVYFIDATVSPDRSLTVEVIMPKHDRTEEEQAANASKQWRHQLGLLTGGGCR